MGNDGPETVENAPATAPAAGNAVCACRMGEASCYPHRKHLYWGVKSIKGIPHKEDPENMIFEVFNNDEKVWLASLQKTSYMKRNKN